ncbi:MAG: ABC transporter ATP-binding protein [Lachnotalea sp.]
MNCAISFNNITKIINEEKILDGLTLHIKKGDIYGLLGENGAGKTTMIKLLFHIIKPTGGTIQILDKTVQDNNFEIFSKVGSIIETPIFYLQLSGKENLQIHCDYNNIKYDKIDKTLELVGLKDAKSKEVKNYSLGMKQRLGIARAIIHEPEILILDEPINGLDPKGIYEIRNLLLELNRRHHTTILMSSHIIGELMKISNKIGILHNGKIVEELDLNSWNKEIDLENYFIQSVGGNHEKAY